LENRNREFVNNKKEVTFMDDGSKPQFSKTKLNLIPRQTSQNLEMKTEEYFSLTRRSPTNGE
jgi:hypothetical protein